MEFGYNETVSAGRSSDQRGRSRRGCHTAPESQAGLLLSPIAQRLKLGLDREQGARCVSVATLPAPGFFVPPDRKPDGILGSLIDLQQSYEILRCAQNDIG